jgi:hypothetical protein
MTLDLNAIELNPIIFGQVFLEANQRDISVEIN